MPKPLAESRALDAQDVPIHETTSLCRVCKHAARARVIERDGQVIMHKHCPEHGDQSVALSNNPAWYRATRAIEPREVRPRNTPRPIDEGCPFDCGACAAHAQRVRLPVVTITSACNLDCPICYVHNKNHQPYHMSMDEFSSVLARLREELDGDIELLNLTGGDPTLHPQMFEFIEAAQAMGVHRVSICTNGVLFVKNPEWVERLAALGGRVALSFDSFEEDADYQMQGAHLIDLKLEVMDLLEKHDVDTTIIPVVTRGLNDHELGRIIRECFLERPNVRHLEFHTITYTGQSGVDFPRAGRISMYEVLERIAAQTHGLLTPEDFVPSPCAHPLCYQIAYLLIDPDGRTPPIPFTRLIGRETLYECLSEHLYIEPTARLERAMQDAIDRLWAACPDGDGDGESDGESERTRQILAVLKRVLDQLFPTDRALTPEESLRVSERYAKAIYVHSHMDEETFDVERVAQCCDSNCYGDGTTIPVCSYNVLYRETEAHFMLEPKPRMKRRGGHLFPIVSGP